MSDAYTIHPIARNPHRFLRQFGIPRQSGLVAGTHRPQSSSSRNPGPHALVGLDGYSHLWLIWQFSTVAEEYAAGKHWRPTVRPPRLGGNVRRGVFATRSPYRPNGPGLSCVELAGIEGCDLLVKGQTSWTAPPSTDIKPYRPTWTPTPTPRAGSTARTAGYALDVVCDAALLGKVPKEKRAALLGVLKKRPPAGVSARPRTGVHAGFWENKVRFTVDGQTLTVREIL